MTMPSLLQEPAPTFITPRWPVPQVVRALLTTRQGGYSKPPFAAFNMSANVGDDPHAVAANRALLRRHLPADPCWLNQIHGAIVVRAEDHASPVEADGIVAARPHLVCAVRSADCLTVLFCDTSGTRVGAAHAGWRGLAAGILEATITALAVEPRHLLAYLGPCIGPDHFQVRADMRDTFLRLHPADEVAFVADGAGYWMADLRRLAQLRLLRAGVENFYGEDRCTHCDDQMLYSHRRDQPTGHMAALIWLERPDT